MSIHDETVMLMYELCNVPFSEGLQVLNDFIPKTVSRKHPQEIAEFLDTVLSHNPNQRDVFEPNSGVYLNFIHSPWAHRVKPNKMTQYRVRLSNSNHRIDPWLFIAVDKDDDEVIATMWIPV